MLAQSAAFPAKKKSEIERRHERAKLYIGLGYSAWRVSEICGVQLVTAQAMKDRYGE